MGVSRNDASCLHPLYIVNKYCRIKPIYLLRVAWFVRERDGGW